MTGIRNIPKLIERFQTLDVTGYDSSKKEGYQAWITEAEGVTLGSSKKERAALHELNSRIFSLYYRAPQELTVQAKVPQQVSLLSEFRAWYNHTYQGYNSWTFCRDPEAKLKEVEEKYPLFAQLLVENSEMRRQFFESVMRDNNPVEVVVKFYHQWMQGPKHSCLSGRMGWGLGKYEHISVHEQDGKVMLVSRVNGKWVNILEQEASVKLEKAKTIGELFKLSAGKAQAPGPVDFHPLKGFIDADTYGWDFGGGKIPSADFRKEGWDLDPRIPAETWTADEVKNLLQRQTVIHPDGKEKPIDGTTPIFVHITNEQGKMTLYKTHAFCAYFKPCAEGYRLMVLGAYPEQISLPNFMRMAAGVIQSRDDSLCTNHRRFTMVPYAMGQEEGERMVAHLGNQIADSLEKKFGFEYLLKGCAGFVQNLMNKAYGEKVAPQPFLAQLEDVNPGGILGFIHAFGRRVPIRWLRHLGYSIFKWLLGSGKPFKDTPPANHHPLHRENKLYHPGVPQQILREQGITAKQLRSQLFDGKYDDSLLDEWQLKEPSLWMRPIRWLRGSSTKEARCFIHAMDAIETSKREVDVEKLRQLKITLEKRVSSKWKSLVEQRWIAYITRYPTAEALTVPDNLEELFTTWAESYFEKEESSKKEKIRMLVEILTRRYPAFAAYIGAEGNEKIREKFLKFTLRDGHVNESSMALFIQAPALTKKLKYQYLLPRIGSFPATFRWKNNGPEICYEYHQEGKAEKRWFRLDRPADVVRFSPSFSLSVEEILQTFADDNKQFGKVIYTHRGIVPWDVNGFKRADEAECSWKQENLDWFNSIPEDEVISIEEAKKRFGNEFDGFAINVMAARRRDPKGKNPFDFEETHSYLEFANRNNEGQIEIRYLSFFSKGEFPHTLVKQLKFVGNSVEGALVRDTNHSAYKRRVHGRVSHCVSKEVFHRFVNEELQRDARRGVDGEIVFQIMGASCAYHVNDLYNRLLKIEGTPPTDLFTKPLLEATPSGPLHYTLSAIRRTPLKWMRKQLVKLHLLPFVPSRSYRGHSLLNMHTWRKGTYSTPGKLFERPDCKVE